MVETTDASPAVVVTEEDRLRADFYALLAVLFRSPPGEDLLEELRVLSIGQPDTDLGRGLAALRKGADEARTQDVETEFNDLFIGLGRGQVLPYGSWYLAGSLMDRPLMALRADLARLGMSRQPHVREPEDHLAALCEVMALLLAEDGDQRAAGDFFRHHMEPWVSGFCEDLQKAPAADFYQSVAQLARTFFGVEARYLAMPV